jgi:DNA repair protein RadC
LSQYILKTVSNDLNKLARLSPNDLMRIQGIGHAKATSVIAALELGRRRKDNGTNRHPILQSSAAVHEYVKDLFYDLEFEEFWVLILNRGNEVVNKKRISQGGVSGTVADSKLIFKYTLEELGSSIIVMHNHPSGNLTPSKADEVLTRKIREAAENLDIQLLDHLIIHNHRYFSFADEGML